MIDLNDQVTRRAMRTLCLPAAVGIAAAPSPVKVLKQAAPERALIFEVTIPAPRAAVWQAFSIVDLRNGGEWTARFPGGRTGGGTIVSFIPEREMTLSALAPEQFPTVRAERTIARFEFIADGDSMVVRLVQTGWKNGEEWDKAYDYLAEGNARLLETLRRRFTDGPIDWVKEWGDPK
jgi:uncharacterized protein YndB with AHSA1/START domain